MIKHKLLLILNTVIISITSIILSLIVINKINEPRIIQIEASLESINKQLDKIENIEEIEYSTIKSITETKIIEDEPLKKGYIFIGDSRFVGMNQICNINDNTDKFVIAKVGEGYNYLVNIAIPEAENIKQENSDIEHWEYIICLGVNDLGNLNKYSETYNELSKENDINLVSVNPVEYHNYISNKSIEQFNDTISNIDNIKYIDTYSWLIDNGFKTVDGVHYSKETYIDIYKQIKYNMNIQDNEEIQRNE